MVAISEKSYIIMASFMYNIQKFSRFKMKHFFLPLSIVFAFACNSFGQASNGRMNSLLAAENYFAAFAKEKGIREAFLKVSDSETLLFRPNPVKAEEFFDKKSEDQGGLSWEPAYARLSRSGDWGFTTGPYTHTAPENAVPTFGQYLSVWRANKKGVWKLALDLGISHPKPQQKPELNFKDPRNFKFFRQLSPARLKQREDMIMTTDQLFSNTLRKNQDTAYEVFTANEARLLFPGYEPIIGKANISNFRNEHELSIITEPVQANRALGSDLAYTYGTAHITKNNVSSAYNYVRIWESQEGFKWNVILEIFSPAKIF